MSKYLPLILVNVCLVVSKSNNRLDGTNIAVRMAFFIGDLNEWKG